MKKILAVILVLVFLVGCQPKDVSETAEEEPEKTSEPSRVEQKEEPPAPVEEPEPAPVEETPSEEEVEEEPTTETVEVRITSKSFDPAMITIKLGDTVTWTNENQVPMMISGPKKTFTAKIYPDESFSYTFEELGTHNIIKVVAPIFFQKVTVVAE